MFIVVTAYFSISEIHCFYVICGYKSRYLERNTHDFSTKSDSDSIYYLLLTIDYFYGIFRPKAMVVGMENKKV